MHWIFPVSRSMVLLRSIIRASTSKSSNHINDNEDVEQRDRAAVTKKIRLLGLRNNQPRQALAIYDDFVYRQKKKPDLRMLTAAINCATVTKDLEKGREIHQFIEQSFPQWKDDLLLKQQLRYLYVKCNDQASAHQLFQSTSNTKEEQTSTSIDSTETKETIQNEENAQIDQRNDRRSKS